MSLSVCTQKVRITSPNGTFLSEGETRCTDIATLKNLGYTIEELEEPTQPDFTSIEEIVEPTPIQEEIIIQEPETIVNIPVEDIEEIQVVEDVFIMQADLLINRSFELATENINLKTENQQLKQEAEQAIEDFNSEVDRLLANVPFKNEKEYNEFLLEKQIASVHGNAQTVWTNIQTNRHPRPEGREAQYKTWMNLLRTSELGLENFANDLGLKYTRRTSVNNETVYYDPEIYNPPPEIFTKEWQSYIPTSSATRASKR